jgi:hypothetical protein
MGLIYFFCLPAFESPGIFCCDAPFIVPNPDLAFARLVIEFHQRSRLLSGLLDLFVYKITGDCPGAGNTEGRFRFPSGLTAPGGSLSFKVGKGSGFGFFSTNNFSHSLGIVHKPLLRHI